MRNVDKEAAFRIATPCFKANDKRSCQLPRREKPQGGTYEKDAMVDRGSFSKMHSDLRFVDKKVRSAVVPLQKRTRLAYDFQPNNWTVICGKGKASYNHGAFKFDEPYLLLSDHITGVIPSSQFPICLLQSGTVGSVSSAPFTRKNTKRPQRALKSL